MKERVELLRLRREWQVLRAFQFYYVLCMYVYIYVCSTCIPILTSQRMAGNTRILTLVLLLCLCICLKTNMMINDDDKAETDVDFCLQEKLERLEEGILGDLGRQVLDASNDDDDDDKR